MPLAGKERTVDNEQAPAATETTAQAAANELMQQAQPAPDAQAAPEVVDALPSWAQNEIRKLRRENESHRKAKAQAERQAAEQAEKQAADQGKWQDLYEKVQPRVQRAEDLEAFVNEQLETRLASVPDRLKALVPEGDALAKLRWVLAAEAAGVLAEVQAPQTAASAGGAGFGRQPAEPQLTEAEATELAAIYGVSAKYIPR